MICDAPWPVYDESLIVFETVEYVIQINGKVRDRMELPTDTAQPDVEAAAFARERVQQWTNNKNIIKKIFIPNRLLNIVVKG